MFVDKSAVSIAICSTIICVTIVYETVLYVYRVQREANFQAVSDEGHDCVTRDLLNHIVVSKFWIKSFLNGKRITETQRGLTTTSPIYIKPYCRQGIITFFVAMILTLLC